MAPQSLNRVGAPFRSAQIKAANGIAAKNTVQRRQRVDDMVLAPKSTPLHAWGLPMNSIARASAIAAKKGEKTCAQLVAFSRPGRADLTKRGTPVPITLRAKISFIDNHFRCIVE
jgi:hypothetical protein